MSSDVVDFSGSYADPNHPNCLREIKVEGTTADVSGTDGDPGCPPDGSGDGWDLVGKVDGDTILVDFSPKGGPANLKGVYESSPIPGIRWPDGNLWSRKDAADSPTPAESDEILIESFANPTHSWHAMNDPVMGGKSYSTVSIENGVATFDGECVDVPFLHAPGFITMETRGGDYPDVSSCENLRLRLRSAEQYSGYRVSFGTKHVPGNRFAFGFKANLDVPAGTKDMVMIDIPFHDFTVRWDDATGDPIVTCEEDEKFCPDLETLQDMQTIQLWGEGVAGKVHLEVESIAASGCSSSAINDPDVISGSQPLMAVAGVGGATAAMLLLATKKFRKGYQYTSLGTE
eukprot:CAMPEP_0197457552 /NCGR_PEP_ID=MMETSP1175-20131217/46408_1 /TAXON_ID=1003142 /ORGANISM="Triceratium dubium, Strain CCMP147" /LENGTH=344 /DNA_ID=CAMNT_0042991953 /DNA_START=107 /DNA_END=1141 /DNA_ORIENTATION=+